MQASEIKQLIADARKRQRSRSGLTPWLYWQGKINALTELLRTLVR